MGFSKRVELLGSGVFQRNDTRKQLYRLNRTKKNLPQLIDLSLGSSDLPPPKNVLKAIAKDLGKPESFSYCLHSGTKNFREAVSTWAKRRFDVRVDPEKEVILLVGSQEGTAHLPVAVMNPGEVGLILDPSYPSHRGGLVIADARIEKLLLREEDYWQPSLESLSSNQLDQLKMILLGFPHNPTAQVGQQSWLDNAMACGVDRQIIVANDNPYVDLALEGEAPSLLRCEDWREWGIEFFSFSKGWCMGGFRLGFAIGAEPLISSLRKVKSVIDFNQSLALQAGAIEALTKSLDWPKTILEVYRERRDRTVSALHHFGWNVSAPSMAMYLWMPLPLWARDRGWNDEEMASKILEKTGVALTPGSGFGAGGKDWIRLALVHPAKELEEAVSKIGDWWNVYS